MNNYFSYFLLFCCFVCFVLQNHAGDGVKGGSLSDGDGDGTEYSSFDYSSKELRQINMIINRQYLFSDGFNDRYRMNAELFGLLKASEGKIDHMDFNGIDISSKNNGFNYDTSRNLKKSKNSDKESEFLRNDTFLTWLRDDIYFMRLDKMDESSLEVLRSFFNVMEGNVNNDIKNKDYGSFKRNPKKVEKSKVNKKKGKSVFDGIFVKNEGVNSTDSDFSSGLMAGKNLILDMRYSYYESDKIFERLVDHISFFVKDDLDLFQVRYRKGKDKFKSNGNRVWNGGVICVLISKDSPISSLVMAYLLKRHCSAIIIGGYDNYNPFIYSGIRTSFGLLKFIVGKVESMGGEDIFNDKSLIDIKLEDNFVMSTKIRDTLNKENISDFLYVEEFKYYNEASFVSKKNPFFEKYLNEKSVEKIKKVNDVYDYSLHLALNIIKYRGIMER